MYRFACLFSERAPTIILQRKYVNCTSRNSLFIVCHRAPAHARIVRFYSCIKPDRVPCVTSLQCKRSQRVASKILYAISFAKLPRNSLCENYTHSLILLFILQESFRDHYVHLSSSLFSFVKKKKEKKIYRCIYIYIHTHYKIYNKKYKFLF